MARTELLQFDIMKNNRFYASFNYLCRYTWKNGFGPVLDWDAALKAIEDKFPSLVNNKNAVCYCGDVAICFGDKISAEDIQRLTR